MINKWITKYESLDCPNCHRSIREIYDANSDMASGIEDDIRYCPFCGSENKELEPIPIKNILIGVIDNMNLCMIDGFECPFINECENGKGQCKYFKNEMLEFILKDGIEK